MDTASLAVILSLADRYGVVVVFVAFALEGAVIGKLLPTRALFVAIGLATGLTLGSAASIAAAAVAGATIGQAVLFVAVRRLGVDPVATPRLPVTEAHVTRATRWLDRWGPASVAISNAFPLVRGTMTVPTALSRVPGRTFAAYSVVGSAVYAALLLGVAGGIGGLFPFGFGSAGAMAVA